VNHAIEVIFQDHQFKLRWTALLLRLEEKKERGLKMLVINKSFCLQQRESLLSPKR
jgi:hypothetical protein